MSHGESAVYRQSASYTRGRLPPPPHATIPYRKVLCSDGKATIIVPPYRFAIPWPLTTHWWWYMGQWVRRRKNRAGPATAADANLSLSLPSSLSLSVAVHPTGVVVNNITGITDQVFATVNISFCFLLNEPDFCCCCECSLLCNTFWNPNLTDDWTLKKKKKKNYFLLCNTTFSSTSTIIRTNTDIMTHDGSFFFLIVYSLITENQVTLSVSSLILYWMM